jgi:hypothetical protein
MNQAKAQGNPASVGGLVDLDKRPVAEVLAALDVKADKGLSNAEAEQRCSSGNRACQLLVGLGRLMIGESSADKRS